MTAPTPSCAPPPSHPLLAIPPCRSARHILVGILLIAASICPTKADDHPEAPLFRVDTRKPEEVYGPAHPPNGSRKDYGFHPFGKDTDLIKHVLGVTCKMGSGTSAYISLTDSADFAALYALELSMNAGGVPVYVYEIDRSTAFRQMASLLRAIPLEERGNVDWDGVIRNAERQHEWISPARIPVETIRGHRVYDARTYQRVARPPLDRDPINIDTRPGLPRVPNTYYVDHWPAEQSASVPAIIVRAPEGTSYRYYSVHPSVGACFSGTAHCRSNSTRNRRSTDEACTFVERTKADAKAMPGIIIYLMTGPN